MAELIVALDLASRAEAERLVERLGDETGFYKIGYQLFYGGDGLALGRELMAAGKRVFFDLKLLDIPNTISHGVAAIAGTGATMLTVHAYPQAMRAAADAAQGSGLTLLGVSVLTSMDAADLAAAHYDLAPKDLVRLRAMDALKAGMGGLACAPTEAGAVRAATRAGFAIVTPGIRPAGADAGDQKRAASPSAAIAKGATHLVVGRPITAAPDPKAAAKAIRAEMLGR
jgi:orotidine-5'-phosphate decarboxylase